MSPVTIKELDGLPSGEIHLAIAQSENRQVGLMELKLAEHREVIEHRLDSQDVKLEAMQEDLTSLVGSDKIPGQVTRLSEMVRGLVDKHDEWHAQDATFRLEISSKVSKLSDDQSALAEDVRPLKWFILACAAIGKLAKTTFKVAREGKDMYKAVAACGISWLVIVQFVHVVWPAIKSFLQR
jgi:hypothetical protein